MATQQHNVQSHGRQQPQNGGEQPSQRDYDREDPSVGVELTLDDEACISASAECGEVSTDICDGCTFICAGPTAGCDMACDCSDDVGVVIHNGCELSLCGASCIVGCCLVTLGLALDSKVTWTPDEVEFELMGTGIDTKEGFALNVLGSQIGFVDEEKKQKYEEKKQRRKRKQPVVDQPQGRQVTS